MGVWVRGWGVFVGVSVVMCVCVCVCVVGWKSWKMHDLSEGGRRVGEVQ